jgi:hypothetical protein
MGLGLLCLFYDYIVLMYAHDCSWTCTLLALVCMWIELCRVYFSAIDPTSEGEDGIEGTTRKSLIAAHLTAGEYG